MQLGDSGSFLAFAIWSHQSLDSPMDLGFLFVSVTFLGILVQRFSTIVLQHTDARIFKT